MISRIHPRGVRVSGLLRYLFGPGRKEEHSSPRLVAAWDGAGDLAGLEPPDVNGHRDVRALTAMLNDPIQAGYRPPAKPVWHCSLRLAPEDRTLGDAQWNHIAREVMAQAGLAHYGDDDAVRWIAVRHADDHIHIAATLVRQDRRTEWARNDYRRVRTAVMDLERRYGLRSTAPSDGTAGRGVHARELNKADRQRRTEIPRQRLRREVRAVAAIAAGEDDFFASLQAAGVLVHLRHSTIDPAQVTGYSVGWPGHNTKSGEPVWYGGGRLAPDLTLPQLRARWGPEPDEPPAGLAANSAFHRAANAAREATDEMRSASAHATAAGHAGADVLAALACSIGGRHGPALDRAAQLLDHAARQPFGPRRAVTSTRIRGLRGAARLIGMMSKRDDDRIAPAMLELLHSMAMLAGALADILEAQQRIHQAHAARAALRQLRDIAAPGGPRRLASVRPIQPDAVRYPADARPDRAHRRSR